MKAKSSSPVEVNLRRRRIVYEFEGGASGVIAGAVLGLAAGPPGIVVGAIVGAAAGAAAGAALDTESSTQAAHESALDEEIGVTDGELGAPRIQKRAAPIGAYSASSVGVDSASDEHPAEGPMQRPET